jgi:hypothetical protein
MTNDGPAKWRILLAKLRWFPERADAWIGCLASALEVIVLGTIALWTIVGTFRYGAKTGWTFDGLLPILNQNWKGVLVLAGLLFFRTVHQILRRIPEFRTPIGNIPAKPLDPADVPVKAPMMGEPSTKERVS